MTRSSHSPRFFARLPALLAALLLVCGRPASLHAVTVTWTGNTNGTWNTNTNWQGNTAWTNGNSPVFDADNLTGAKSTTITLGANRTAGSITFGASSTTTAFTFSTGSTLTVNSGITNNDNNTQTFNVAIALGGAQSWATTSGAMNFAGNISNGTNLLTLSSGTGIASTISGIIGNGTGGLTVTGGGTWTLSGTNTYTGATTINSGILSISNVANGGTASNLGSASTTASNLVLGGGTLQFTGATDSTNRNFTLTAGTTSSIEVTTAATNLTLSGASTATTGGLTKIGAGTLTLSGTNLYTGATTINAGTLSVGAIGNGGVAGNLGQATNAAGNLIMGGGTLQYTGATTSTDRNFTLTAGTTSTISVTTAANTLTMSGASTATTGGLTKAGAGTLVLSGANLYTGATTVSAGTLLADGSSSLGGAAGNVTVSAGATLALAGGAAITTGSPTNAATITKTGTLTIAGTGASGSTGALAAVGTTGQTSYWVGNIALSAAATVGAADNLLILGNGNTYTNTLALGGTLTLNTTAAATVTPQYLPASTFLLDPTNILLNMKVSGSGGITKTGTGTATLITFNGTTGNTYTGATAINDGTLIIGGTANAPVISSSTVTVGDDTGAAGSAVLQMGFLASPPAVNNVIGSYNATTGVGTSSMTVNSDGFFNMNGGSNSLVNLTLHGGHVGDTYAATNPPTSQSSVLTITGGITTTASTQTAVIDNWKLGMSSNAFSITTAAGGNLEIDAIVANGIGFTNTNTSTSLAKLGTGTLTLTNANSYQGVTSIQAGIVNIQDSSALGQVGSSNGDLNNGTVVANNAQLQLQNNITVGNETLTLSGAGVSTTGALLNVADNNTYNGEIILAADSRINANAGSSLTIANTAGAGATIIDGATANRTLTVGGAGDVNVNSVIASNVGTIVKDGTGTFTLAGQYTANTTTTVNAGTLALDMSGVGLGSSTTVTIGTGSGGTNAASVLLQQSNQIADTAAVTVNTDGLLNVNNQSETIGSITSHGNIILGTGQLIVGGNNTNSTLAGTLAGAVSSVLTKNGTGTLTISSNLNASPGNFLGTINVNAGTLALTGVTDTFSGTLNIAAGAGTSGTILKLTDSFLTVGNLNLTGSGTVTLDFSGVSSKLTVTGTLDIANGVTVQIINWANAADYFYAANWNGAVLGTTGMGDETQVIFDSPTWNGSNTKWQSYDNQITPVPEPSTYGALLLGATGALLGYRRCRRAKVSVGT